jgi:hypothetical protein
MPRRSKTASQKSCVLIFLKKFLKLFRSDLERTNKGTTLSKNQSTYEQEIPHHRIRAQQSVAADAGKSRGPKRHVLRERSGHNSTTGTYDSAFGYSALNANTTGSNTLPG